MFFWHNPWLPPCPLRGLYCAALDLLPSLCVCFCANVCTQLRRTVKHCPFHKWTAKTYRFDHLLCACGFVCARAFLSEWKGIVYSESVTWPRTIYTNTRTHTHKPKIYAVADSTNLASENLEDAEEEDNGTLILSLTGNKAKKEEERQGGRLGRKG